MNRVAFQIYGNKKTGIFQSTWNTNLVGTSTIELATTATGANWSGTSYTLGYTHTPGSSAVLTSAISAAIGLNYRLVATISNYVTGSVTINYGGTSNAGISATTTLELLTSTTGQLTIIPTSDFDGKIVISLKNSSTPSNQLKLPLVSTGTYNFWVDWGDGTYDNITSWNQAQRIHTYASPGTYTTRISGVINNFTFFPETGTVNGDGKKLISVKSWGKVKIGYRAFEGCSNITLNNVDDILDLSLITSMAFMFYGCTAITTIGRVNEWNTSNITSMASMFVICINFNSSLSNWNTSNVTNMNGMFYGCTNFNQNLGNWSVSNCLYFDSMFQFCTNFNNGGSSDINNWVFKTSGNINMNYMFGQCTNFNQPLNNWNTTRVTNMGAMFLGATSFNQNIGAWDVSNWITSGSMFYNATAFNNGGSPDINNWTLNTNPAVNLSFYQMFLGANSFNQPINNWNTVRVTNMGGMFYFNRVFNNGLASGLAGTMSWNTSNCTSMAQMFYYDDAFNQNIGSWDVSKVTDFGDMFLGANQTFNNGGSSDINNWTIKPTGTVNMSQMLRSTAFNQPIGNWNMSKVTNIAGIVQGATSFNQNLDSWNLSTCTNMNNAFASSGYNNGSASGVGNTPTMTLNTTTPFTANGLFSNTAFNGDISSLDFTRCTNTSFMFIGATKYNNGLASGVAGVLTMNTSNVTDMSGMFQSATAFNQDVGLFDVSKVTSFSGMFRGASLYNNGADANPINNWTLNTTVGANINMSYLFYSSGVSWVFNRALNNWNTTEVTNMDSMFSSYGSNVFNQPLNNWNTAKVTNMREMFRGSPFNQDISTWNVANVINMSNMFISAAAFRQNIGNWDVSNVTNFTGFMSTKTPATFPATYLDNIYNGWSTQTLQHTTPISISFGTAKYSQASKAGKDTLTASPNNWIIADGLLTVSGTLNNGGLIRVTTSAVHGFITGDVVYIYGVGGTTNANGTWTVTVISTTIIQLQGSTYNSAWTSGGNVILG